MKRLALGSALLLASVWQLSCSSSGTTSCTPQNCSSGCCDSTGACQSGIVNSACGTSGVICAVCLGAQQCVAGLCTLPNSGCSPACTSGQTCVNGRCEDNTSDSGITDAGTSDGGGTQDSGGPVDSGVNDAGGPPDSGTLPDAGSGTDAGNRDAGAPFSCGANPHCSGADPVCCFQTAGGQNAPACVTGVAACDGGAANIINCGSPADCPPSSPVCCADQTLVGSGTACSLSQLESHCSTASACLTNLQAFPPCPAQDQFSACLSSVDCMDAANPTCCSDTVSSGLRSCVSTQDAALIQAIGGNCN